MAAPADGCATQVLRMGYLTKVGKFIIAHGAVRETRNFMAQRPPRKGGKLRTWKRRFFIVSYDDRCITFTYYKSEAQSDKPLGSFVLRSRECFRLLEPPRSPLADQPAMEVVTGKRTYQMTASDADLREWAWAIERCLGYLHDRSTPVSSTHPTGSVRLCGALIKKGDQRRNWKERWFELNDTVLQYFDLKSQANAKGMRKARGTILLDSCLGVNRVLSTEQPYRFHIEMPSRVYMLRAHSEAQQNAWLQALERVGCPIGYASSGSTFLEPQTYGNDSDSDMDDMASYASASSAHMKQNHKPADDTMRSRAMTSPQSFSNAAVTPGTLLDFSVYPSFAELHVALKPLCIAKATAHRQHQEVARLSSTSSARSTAAAAARSVPPHASSHAWRPESLATAANVALAEEEAEEYDYDDDDLSDVDSSPVLPRKRTSAMDSTAFREHGSRPASGHLSDTGSVKGNRPPSASLPASTSASTSVSASVPASGSASVSASAAASAPATPMLATAPSLEPQTAADAMPTPLPHAHSGALSETAAATGSVSRDAAAAPLAAVSTATPPLAEPSTASSSALTHTPRNGSASGRTPASPTLGSANASTNATASSTNASTMPVPPPRRHRQSRLTSVEERPGKTTDQPQPLLPSTDPFAPLSLAAAAQAAQAVQDPFAPRRGRDNANPFLAAEAPESAGGAAGDTFSTLWREHKLPASDA